MKTKFCLKAEMTEEILEIEISRIDEQNNIEEQHKYHYQVKDLEALFVEIIKEYIEKMEASKSNGSRPTQ